MLLSIKSVGVLISLINLVLLKPVFKDDETEGDTYNGTFLLNSTRPIFYDLHIKTDIHRGETRFSGVAEIYFEAKEVVVDVYLHMGELEIISVALEVAAYGHQHTVSYSHDAEREFLIIHVAGGLFYQQIYRLTIEYNGNLRNDSTGFYLQSYKNSAGKDIHLATTQFESTYARFAFPCYDEPELKAIFRISITHHRSYRAISNMPVLGDIVQNDDSTVTTSFEPTTLISTYLVAWTVSDYVFSEKNDRIPHRLYSKPGFNTQHEFALATSVAVLNSLNDYVKLDYPLPKMDNVAIPSKGGAMENWGMVTYGEQYLLYDEAETTTSSKTTIATIISHEFAHQWFGNMVGPKWWTYTWLNEGFASLFEYYTTNEVYPEWDIMQSFVTGYLRNSLISDGRTNPRPMTHYVETPAGIASVFDYVSYGKSGSVLRMFQHAFTDATFRKALSSYQKEMKYLAAVEEDLFKHFREAAIEDETFGNDAVNIDNLLRSWTNQGGYPLITVTRDYDQGTFTIKQEPFDGTDKAPSGDTRTWWVPYNFATASNADFSKTTMKGYLLPGTSSAIVRQDNEKWSSDDWIVLNKQATSFYRVNYDEQNWKLLINALEADHKKLHPHNRAILLEDAYRLTLANRLDYDTVFEMMSYLKKEEDYAPWAIANQIFLTLNNYLTADSEYRAYRFFVKRMAQDFYTKLGIDEKSTDAHLTKLIRGAIINLACRGNNADCLGDSNKKLKLFAQEGTKIEPNLRATIACTGMINATEFDMNLVLGLLKEVEVQTQRNQILSGVGCLRKISLLKKYLNTTLASSTYYSDSETLNILGYVVEKSAAGVNASIEFLLENHKDYLKLSSDLSRNNPVLSGLRSIAARIFTDEQSKHFDKLLDEVKDVEGIGESQVTAVRNTVKSNLAWTEANRKPIMSWMSTFYDVNEGEKEEEEEEEGGNGGGDGAGAIFVSTGVLAFVSITVLRTVL